MQINFLLDFFMESFLRFSAYIIQLVLIDIYLTDRNQLLEFIINTATNLSFVYVSGFTVTILLFLFTDHL